MHTLQDVPFLVRKYPLIEDLVKVLNINFVLILNTVMDESVFEGQVLDDWWRNILLGVLVVEIMGHSAVEKPLGIFVLQNWVHILLVRIVAKFRKELLTLVKTV